MDLVFLKLGGAVITDKMREASPRRDVIHRAAREVQRAGAANGDLKILLGHGSGSFGHFAAEQWGFGKPDNGQARPSDRWKAYAETGAAAARLNRIFADVFLEQGVPVVSLQPSASAHCRDGELQSLTHQPIHALMEHGLIPLVFGDVALDETLGMTIASTEMIFGWLAPVLRPRRIIYVTAVEGVFSADPSQEPGAELIPEITPSNLDMIESGLGAARGVDVTGGMLDKVRRSLALVQQVRHLEVFVIGAAEGMIERALLEEDFSGGTWIHAGAPAGD
jgi:isopentenyl phosphate kinase